jgi:hypothetical protein
MSENQNEYTSPSGKVIQFVKQTNLLTKDVWYKTLVNGKFIDGSQSMNITEAELFYDDLCASDGEYLVLQVLKETRLP